MKKAQFDIIYKRLPQDTAAMLFGLANDKDLFNLIKGIRHDLFDVAEALDTEVTEASRKKKPFEIDSPEERLRDAADELLVAFEDFEDVIRQMKLFFDGFDNL